MLYILLTIFSSVFLLLSFKLFPKFEINTLVAIVYNYLTAAITGFIFLKVPFSFNEIIYSPWIKVSLPFGGILISVLYLISLTAQRISVSTASIANKMSVAMPVLFSVIFLNQQLSAIKAIGIVLAFVAVYLSSKRDDNNRQLKKLIWLPILVFIGSGLIDTSINAANAFYVRSENENVLFSISAFSSAFLMGIIIIMGLFTVKRIKLSQLFKLKNIAAGLVLGIPNYFSIYFIFKSLKTNILTSAQLFPVLNLSNVVISVVLAYFIFKEKLSALNMIGICAAVLSIILITI